MFPGTWSPIPILSALTFMVSVITAEAQTEWEPGPEQYAVKVKINVQVPMRDGVNLSADIYRPDAPGQFPCLLLRTYWGNNIGPLKVPWGLYFARRGYGVALVDVRGAMTPRVSGNLTSMNRKTATTPNSGWDSRIGAMVRWGRSAAPTTASRRSCPLHSAAPI